MFLEWAGLKEKIREILWDLIASSVSRKTILKGCNFLSLVWFSRKVICCNNQKSRVWNENSPEYLSFAYQGYWMKMIKKKIQKEFSLTREWFFLIIHRIKEKVVKNWFILSLSLIPQHSTNANRIVHRSIWEETTVIPNLKVWSWLQPSLHNTLF